MSRIVLVLATVALMTMSGSSALADGGGGRTIYDSLEIAPNIPSVGPEAYAFKELGDEVTFAGSARALDRVTVTLSSWGCQTGHWYSGDCQSASGATFQQAITLNVYEPATGGTAAGALLATQTRTFRVPYRPSASARCTGGKWYAGSLGCFNGLEWLVRFDFRSQNITLPNTVVYGISYNSSHYGPVPVGEAACFTSSGGCPYDSLNIGLAAKVNVGSKPFPDTIFQNAAPAEYCDSGAAGSGFRLDSPGGGTNACWAGYVPAVRFTARGSRSGDDRDSNNDDQNNGGDNGNGDNGN